MVNIFAATMPQMLWRLGAAPTSRASDGGGRAAGGDRGAVQLHDGGDGHAAQELRPRLPRHRPGGHGPAPSVGRAGPVGRAGELRAAGAGGTEEVRHRGAALEARCATVDASITASITAPITDGARRRARSAGLRVGLHEGADHGKRPRLRSRACLPEP